jgi:hypothetical protein
MSQTGGDYRCLRKILEDGDIVVIDVKYKGETTYFQDKECNMEIVGNIFFGFWMLNLDTLSLNSF